LTDYRYKAFVSYSWADAVWGKWLLHALETYHTPKALVGMAGLHGPVAARLIPLFKDREEEAAGASIGKAVEAALASSEFLIVICSPRSAASKWVNHELAWFKTHRDPDRILALIVDGEPGSGETECFPKALTHNVLADLTITDQPEDAPLAADARDSGDGKRKARLKLAAALLGVGLDELVGRDDRRRALRQRWVTAGSLLFGGSMAALAWTAVQARNEADLQRAESDGLVEFMLTDLREKLEPVGRLDALDVVGQRALKYYAGQKPGSLDADALGRRSRALHLVGEVRDLRGDSETALVAFRQAATTTGELLARDPDNPKRIFDHAQSVFWVGAIAFQRGEMKEAEAAFGNYKKFADQLVRIDPKKPEWLMELKYAESNLGTLQLELGNYLEADRAFSRSLSIIEEIVAQNTEDPGLQIELATSISWVVTVSEYLGERPKALGMLAREMSIYRQILQQDSGNHWVLSQLVNALASLAKVQLANGNLSQTGKTYRTALDLSNGLLRIEPDNSVWLEVNAALHTANAEVLQMSGSFREAHGEVVAAQRALDSLTKRDAKNVEWGIWRRSALALVEGRLAAAEGRDEVALGLFGTVRNLSIDALRNSRSREVEAMQRRTALFMGDVQAKRGISAEATQSWQAALVPSKREEKSEKDLDRVIQFAALLRLGRAKEARAIGRMLDQSGFRHPFYVAERTRAEQARR
jgi:tetratricopeptide (TPR) repeat protein